MSETVSWLLELAVKPGQLESFRTLMEEMVESTKEESGTLAYEWFVDDAGQAVHIYERYTDSGAALVHGETFGQRFAERFLACADPTNLSIYGTPSEELKAGLAGFSPSYLGPFGGFAQ